MQTHLARRGQAFSQGYLSTQEYDTRLQQAWQADTAGALDRLLTDLPIDRINRRDPRRRARRIAAARRGLAIHFVAWLAMSLTVVGSWLAVALTVGAWYFWPIWPILGGGIGIVSHAVPVRPYVRSHHSAD
ncbi:MAG TPA: DUF1707 domain-containing protein [Mycobacterium sp.]|nr:DUF1707 domain-containing protein [Mycobacterium sp.]HUH70136.1 DUF1707 domain-containing protein [Mycobacterium sp.]